MRIGMRIRFRIQGLYDKKNITAENFSIFFLSTIAINLRLKDIQAAADEAVLNNQLKYIK